jgi:hypothetical protein
MKRAIIALVTAVLLTMSGLTFGPALRATALGETSVTLNCNDGTSLTLLVDANMLSRLTAAVQAMIDYPAGLGCTLVQNPIPLTVSFGQVARAAVADDFIVDGGRWLVGCSFFGQFSSVPSGVMARSGKGPAFASRITTVPLATPDCPESECVWVNIGVNLHFNGNGTLEGTLNETIPEHQFCGNGQLAVGPNHFTSKPTPPNTNLSGCLRVNPLTHQATVITYVTQISGLETFPAGGFLGQFLTVGSEVHASFIDKRTSPSQQTDSDFRDHLKAPPAIDDSICRPAPQEGGFGTQNSVQQNGNINVRP